MDSNKQPKERLFLTVDTLDVSISLLMECYRYRARRVSELRERLNGSIRHLLDHCAAHTWIALKKYLIKSNW